MKVALNSSSPFLSQQIVHSSVTFCPPPWADHHNSSATKSINVEKETNVIFNKSLNCKIPTFLKDVSK